MALTGPSPEVRNTNTAAGQGFLQDCDMSSDDWSFLRGWKPFGTSLPSVCSPGQASSETQQTAEGDIDLEV